MLWAADWRDAWIVPVFKKGDKYKATNYRPVSSTSITCKLLEHIVHSNVMAPYDQHGILKDNQHSFCKKCSCETQLDITIQEIASCLLKGNQVDVILLDFAKAFDKVPRSRLLYKMEHYGIQNQTRAWIQAFLGDRKQEVILDGAHSTQADVLSGVPQGTVPGPLLFLAYINDLPEFLRSSDCRLFADDRLLYCTVNKDTESALLQRDLTVLEEWEKTLQMSFNPSKCSVIRVTSGKIYVQLSWTKHIIKTASKANRSLGFLRRNSKDCSKQVIAKNYTTVVCPVLE